VKVITPGMGLIGQRSTPFYKIGKFDELDEKRVLIPITKLFCGIYFVAT
jgi:hypothetical protein